MPESPARRPLWRRQMWIVVMLAAVAYLWWQSLKPGRYVEMPLDPDRSGALPDDYRYEGASAWALDPADYVGIAASPVRKRLRLASYLDGDTLRVHTEWYVEQTRRRTCRADLSTNLDLEHMVVRLDEDTTRQVEWQDGRLTLPPGRAGGEALSLELSGVVLVEDLLCVQASRWRAVPEPVPATLLAFTGDDPPVTPVAVHIESDADSIVWIHTENDRSIRIGYHDAVPPIRSFTDGSNTLFEVFVVRTRPGDAPR